MDYAFYTFANAEVLIFFLNTILKHLTVVLVYAVFVYLRIFNRLFFFFFYCIDWLFVPDLHLIFKVFSHLELQKAISEILFQWANVIDVHLTERED